MYKETDSKPFESKVWLASPTMHGEEIKYINEAYETNWMSCFLMRLSSSPWKTAYGS